MDPVAKTPTKPVDYAVLSSGYAALAGAVLLAARDHGDEPVSAAEILPLGVATFALSKLIAKEKVESWVREPFVEELPGGERRPKGRRLRYAVGELLTCTRCVGAWSSLGLVGLRVARPREARLVTAVLGASAVNDFLQTGFTRMCAQANLAQQQADAPPREAGERRFAHS
ncbi:MAG: hypothetical protein JWM73_556 [Solirubrobacterales bacterium]|nr:hypothetical protein [Solirubrobacterales bacterium]